jgi:hypothetical protein
MSRVTPSGSATSTGWSPAALCAAATTSSPSGARRSRQRRRRLAAGARRRLRALGACPEPGPPLLLETCELRGVPHRPRSRTEALAAAIVGATTGHWTVYSAGERPHERGTRNWRAPSLPGRRKRSARTIAAIQGLLFSEGIEYGYWHHKDTSSWWEGLVRSCLPKRPHEPFGCLWSLTLLMSPQPLVSSCTATPSAPASMCSRTSSLQYGRASHHTGAPIQI